MPSNPEPTQPLADERLAAIRGRFKEVINDRKHKVSLRATDMYDLLSEVDRLRSENAAWALSRAAAEPVHSVQLGRGDTACGVALPGVLPWDTARLDFSSPTLTTRPEKATCPECVAALDQSGEGQANEG